MQKLFRPIAAIVSLAAAFGVFALIVSATADSSSAKVTTTFTKDIKPLTSKCQGCHAGAMSDYDKLITKKLVVPNKPNDSKFYLKPSGKLGHPGGDVWKDKTDLVKTWIATGATK
jgi:hypothetical protein